MLQTIETRGTSSFPPTWNLISDEHNLQPLRVEVYGLDHLETHARRLAEMTANTKVCAGRPLSDYFVRNTDILRMAHHQISEAYRNHEPLGNDADWILDNFHIISDALREVRTDLPKKYYSLLPKLVTGPLIGHPRVYALALDLTAHSDSGLNESNLTRFVQAFQSITPLTVGELWAIPIMLRLCLIDNIRRLAEQIIQFRSHRHRARKWMNEQVASNRNKWPVDAVCLDQIGEEWRDCYIIHLLEAAHDHATTHPEVPEELEKGLTEVHDTMTEVLRREKQRQAANQVSISNCVTSLRLLAALDWRKFFETTSLLETALKQDPAGVYPQQNFATRDRYRQTVEKLARGTEKDELEVARLLLQAAGKASAHGNEKVRRHIGYYLVDEGAREFESLLGYRPSLREWTQRFPREHPYATYFGTLAVTVGASLALLAWVSLSLGADVWLTLGVLLAALLPAAEIAVHLVNYLTVSVLAPRTLPCFDLSRGVPADCSTFIVIPSLLSSKASAVNLVERLEIHYLSNPEKNVFFALLTDFTDAHAEKMPEDDELLQIVTEGIYSLNEKYAAESAPIFFLLHRRRQWNPSEGCWMAWERKRGKLSEFNRLLRGDQTTSFVTVSEEFAALPRIRFVITLDTDTQLSRETARRMIAVLAHPLNQPCFDPAQQRVVRGYGIVQPRIGLSLRGARKSLFARIFSGSVGLDPYTTAVSDVYQDLFGSGSFTGKGIYDVDAFEAAVGHRFPDNHILSHDLIEGNYARCGLATDIELLDDFPSHYLAYMRREHRWVRGDWQILPWLFPWVPGSQDRKETNPLPTLERWKIFDNLRRSVTPAGTLAFLVLGWMLFPGSSWLWSTLAVVVLFFPALLQTVSMAGRIAKKWLQAERAQVSLRDLGYTAAQAGLSAIFLPSQAYNLADAILRTACRLFVTRRHLLEWESAAVTERRVGLEPGTFLRALWSGPAIALAVGGLLWIAEPDSLLSASPFLCGWLLSPLIAYLISQPRKRAMNPLTSSEEEEMRVLARKTWSFFETFVGAEDNWLPPDNYQEDPKNEVAHRTSPTNIGLYLLSCVAAHDFGYLNRTGLFDRVGKTLATLKRMERAHGHFYNWYETQTLRPLLPMYLSTVDSGNFAACLVTLKHALLEHAKFPEVSQFCNQLVQELETLMAEMDFRLLYDSERHLFAVGYNLSQGRLDNSHYDLLASEASLTSFLAVARRDVPRKHWFHLGRPLTEAEGCRVLLSWGGTMFEYLMPRLLLSIDSETLLGESEEEAVKAQIAYGRRCGRPWGISESAYSAVDAQFNYQYQTFGVPSLGLKRGLGKDLVVAPYATGLAFQVDPRQAFDNLIQLRKEGAEGKYGFYESIDYTAERLPEGKRCVVVKCYMAHHQGMTLLSLANCLLNNPMPRRFHAEPMVRATELLLQERVPPEVPLAELQTQQATVTAFHEVPPHLSRRITTPHTVLPRTHLLASSQYSLMVTSAGASCSTARGLAVTRWREDRTCEAYGQFYYLRNVESGDCWSVGYQPLCNEPDEYEVTCATDKVEFRSLSHGIETRMEIVVSPEHHAEVRRLTVTNHNDLAYELEITSYMEVVLTSQAADVAHPAFGKLFLETEYLEGSHALLCRRRPRGPEEKPVWGLHVMAMQGATAEGLEHETARALFMGRGRTAGNPAALDPEARFQGRRERCSILSSVCATVSVFRQLPRYKSPLRPP